MPPLKAPSKHELTDKLRRIPGIYAKRRINVGGRFLVMRDGPNRPWGIYNTRAKFLSSEPTLEKALQYCWTMDETLRFPEDLLP